ncbi:hypothetical protein [Stenotrophomonas sp. PS02289]|uniref:hypothetical protein n=1 Tax=Stenotrophomonas sp. PS02289 TaxID=2991422 RepID=UPI00249BD4D5|nr:hypothetical protein [Stenotrophomonas sp. PS02289]
MSAADSKRRSYYFESRESVASVEVGMYAQESGLSCEEARLALARQELAIPHIGALRTEFRDRLAGLFWVRRPSQHIVVRLTGNDIEMAREIKTEAGVVPVKFETGAAATVAQLADKLNTAGPALRRAVPGLSGTWVDETNGRIVLDVAAPAAAEDSYEKERRVIENLIGSPVEFRFMPAPRDLM